MLLAELDDINPDGVPLIADAILAPLLAASRGQGDPFAIGRPKPPAKSMGDTAAAGFLVALDILPKLLGLTAGVPALSEEAPVPEDCRALSGAQYKERVVSRLFRARWPGAVSIGMCQVLRDLDLEEGQLKVAVARVLRHLRKSAKLHDLPPLTYQLLLLAGRYGASAECMPRFRLLFVYQGWIARDTRKGRRRRHLLRQLGGSAYYVRLIITFVSHRTGNHRSYHNTQLAPLLKFTMFLVSGSVRRPLWKE